MTTTFEHSERAHEIISEAAAGISALGLGYRESLRCICWGAANKLVAGLPAHEAEEDLERLIGILSAYLKEVAEA